jgi:hypothetical protein
MRHLPLALLAERVTRQVACVQCYQRPPGTEALGPEVPRACEPSCPLFAHLPGLISLARDVGERPGECEHAVLATVCASCHLRPTSGEFCAHYQSRECPLSRYGDNVVTGLQRVHASHPAQGPVPSYEVAP